MRSSADEARALIAYTFRALIEQMHEPQRARAAQRLRDIEGDPAARRFFTKVAIAIETFEDGKR